MCDVILLSYSFKYTFFLSYIQCFNSNMMWRVFLVLRICYSLCLLCTNHPFFSSIRIFLLRFYWKYFLCPWNEILFFFMLIVIEFAFSWHTKILHALLTHLRKLSLTLAKWSDSSTPSSSWHSVLHTSHSVHQGVLWAFYLSTVLLVS